MAVIWWLCKARVFAPGKPFQISLMISLFYLIVVSHEKKSFMEFGAKSEADIERRIFPGVFLSSGKQQYTRMVMMRPRQETNLTPTLYKIYNRNLQVFERS